MAKIRPGLITLSGKMGDEVYVHSLKYGRLIRRAPAPGLKREEAAFREQYNRTAFLNKLAGELNTIIRAYGGNLKSGDFYPNLLTRFRKEPLDNRFLLLLQLKGMDINRYYPFAKLGSCRTTVKEFKNKIAVSLEILSHPERGKYRANCYYYEVLLLSWTKSKEPATHTGKLSDWIRISGGKPLFEFLFPRPAATAHWLLCLRQRLGIDKREIESFAAEAMQIVDAGTFDKKDKALLKKRAAGKEAERATLRVKKIAEEVVRVKAKRIT